MPVTQEVVVDIVCDNPACPGHPDLDPHNRTGWLFITSEVYGEPTNQHVFGSTECVNAATESTPAIFTSASPNAPTLPPA